MKFCFVCGKSTEKLIEGYCEECYNKEFRLIDVPKVLSITMCSKCSRIKYKNAWKEMEAEDVLKDEIKILGRDVDMNISTDKNVIRIDAKGFLKNSKKLKEESHDIRLKVNKIVCTDCSRRLGDYYEAIIQLRGDIDAMMDFLSDRLVKERKVCKILKVRNGID